MNNLGCCAITNKAKQLMKLYERGNERLEKEMSIEKIVKNLRDIRIYIKENLISDNQLVKFEI